MLTSQKASITWRFKGLVSPRQVILSSLEKKGPSHGNSKPQQQQQQQQQQQSYGRDRLSVTLSI